MRYLVRVTPDAPPLSHAQTSLQASRLVRTLLALPELAMRIAWLGDELPRTPTPALARVLSECADRAQSTDADAREALLALSIYLAQKRDSALVWALREEAKSQVLLNLERLVRERSESDPQADEIELEPRVPSYVAGKDLSVGERRSLARRPTRLQIDKLLLDPSPLVLEQLFQCPQLIEEDVIRIAARRPARVVAIELLIHFPRWVARRRVRMAMILNPGSPHGIALPLVHTCPREDLNLIITTEAVSATIRAVAHELYCRLPPLRETATHPQQH